MNSSKTLIKFIYTIFLQIVEIFYGFSVSAEVAYYTYIYVKVDNIHFRKVTSFIYSATFLGNLGSAIISQLMVSFKIMNYLELHYLSLGSATVALCIALLLPGVKDKEYSKVDPNETLIIRIMSVSKLLWKDFKEAYSNTYVLIWSLYWAAEKAGNYQIVTYYKSMLQEKLPDEEGKDDNFNGAVQAIQCVLSEYFKVLRNIIPACFQFEYV